MHKILSLGVILTLLDAAFSLPPARAQQSTEVSAREKQWRQENDHGNRYEGLRDRPNASRQYDLLGFFALREVPSDAPNLALSYYLPVNTHLESIRVEEIHPETTYSMVPKSESVPSAPGQMNTFKSWSVSPVIRKYHVALQNLGAIVRLNGGILAPAFLTSDATPLCLTLQQHQPDAYSLFFVSHKELSSIACTVTGSDGKLAPCTLRGAARTGKPSLQEAVPADFLIPFGNLKPGITVIRLNGEYANSDNSLLSAEFRFNHQPLDALCR